MLGPLTLDRYL